MNASTKSFSSGSADGEVTAELPVLDVAAYEARQGHDPLSSTDTWSAPTLNTALLPQLSIPADPVPEVPQATFLSAKLETELRSLASNLAELETRLAAKGERLMIIEAELEESRNAGQSAAHRAALLAEELNSARAAMAAASHSHLAAMDTAHQQIQGLQGTIHEHGETIQAAAEREAALKLTIQKRDAEIARAAAQDSAKAERLLAAGLQIETLQTTVQEHGETIRVAAERETALKQSIEQREAEIATTAAAEAAKTAALVAGHERSVELARQQVGQMQAQSAAQLEALHSMEGRRGIFDSILRGLDLQIVAHDQQQARLAEDLARNTTHGLELTRELDHRAERVTQLEAEVAALNSRLGSRNDEVAAIAKSNDELKQGLEALRQESTTRATRIAELEAQLTAGNHIHAEAIRSAATAHSELQAAHAALTTRNAALDTELGALRQQSIEHVAAVQQVTAEHASRLEQLQARDAQILTLTSQVETQARTILSDSERLRATDERIAIVENDLRVSEEAINRLESDVRTRSMRVEELTKINSQMQGEIADAKRWLDERDALMQRLETEAAHSAALVDNIQRSIRSLSPGAGAANGPVAPEKAPAAAATAAAAATPATVATPTPAAPATPATSGGTHEAVREGGARLLVRKQDGHEVVHVLGRKTTIGRTPDNDLQIDASFVSRHHAVLLVTGAQTVIEDLNSTNGVHVNGQKITREVLNDGDVVKIGKARFRFAVRVGTARASVEQQPSA